MTSENLNLDVLSLGLAFYDILMALILLVITQISTQFAGVHGEYRIRSLVRRCTYFAVIFVLLYRAYAIADDQWGVTFAGAITNGVLIFAITFLAGIDTIWEFRKRRFERVIEKIEKD